MGLHASVVVVDLQQLKFLSIPHKILKLMNCSMLFVLALSVVVEVVVLLLLEITYQEGPQSTTELIMAILSNGGLVQRDYCNVSYVRTCMFVALCQ